MSRRPGEGQNDAGDAGPTFVYRPLPPNFKTCPEPICVKSKVKIRFKNRDSVFRHYKYKHPKVPVPPEINDGVRYPCTYCNKHFKCEHVLVMHIFRMHGIKVNTQLKRPNRKLADQPFEPQFAYANGDDQVDPVRHRDTETITLYMEHEPDEVDADPLANTEVLYFKHETDEADTEPLAVTETGYFKHEMDDADAETKNDIEVEDLEMKDDAEDSQMSEFYKDEDKAEYQDAAEPEPEWMLVNVPRYNCAHCSTSVTRREALEIHMVKEHPNVEPLPLGARIPRVKVQIWKQVIPKPIYRYVCTICEHHSYTVSSSLLRHFKQIHPTEVLEIEKSRIQVSGLGERWQEAKTVGGRIKKKVKGKNGAKRFRYPCDQCKVDFGNRERREVHLIRNHPVLVKGSPKKVEPEVGQDELQEQVKPEVINEMLQGIRKGEFNAKKRKRFQCTQCSLDFSRGDRLRLHLTKAHPIKVNLLAVNTSTAPPSYEYIKPEPDDADAETKDNAEAVDPLTLEYVIHDQDDADAEMKDEAENVEPLSYEIFEHEPEDPDAESKNDADELDEDENSSEDVTSSEEDDEDVYRPSSEKQLISRASINYRPWALRQKQNSNSTETQKLRLRNQSKSNHHRLPVSYKLKCSAAAAANARINKAAIVHAHSSTLSSIDATAERTGLTFKYRPLPENFKTCREPSCDNAKVKIRFQARDSVYRHYKYKHPNTPVPPEINDGVRYPCRYCEKDFKYEHVLIMHYIRFHRIKVNTQVRHQNKKLTDQPFGPQFESGDMDVEANDDVPYAEPEGNKNEPEPDMKNEAQDSEMSDSEEDEDKLEEQNIVKPKPKWMLVTVPRYKCANCTKIIARREALEIHVAKEHPTAEPLGEKIPRIKIQVWKKLQPNPNAMPFRYACSICSSDYTTRHSLRRHFKHAHPTEVLEMETRVKKNVKCKVRVKGKRHHCKLCLMDFSCRERLTAHLIRKHCNKRLSVRLVPLSLQCRFSVR